MADLKIMIVEDDEELHTLYGLYLRGASYQVLKAFNGREALKLLAHEMPAVIVLDMIMPEMGGEEFLREIKAKGIAQKTPVIIASVNDKIPRDLTSMPNVFAVLKKPFSIDVLTDKIQQALKSA